MQRFILAQNIERFQNLLTQETNERQRGTLRLLLSSAQRELAAFDSLVLGAQRYRGQFDQPRSPLNVTAKDLRTFQTLMEGASRPYLLLDPRPGLHIIDINDAYSAATMTERRLVAGEKFFDIFPDNPALPDADGVSNLYASLKMAAQGGRPHAMAIQRYDVRDPEGQFVERYWLPLNSPIFDEEGRLLYLLHHVEDVTGEMMKSLAVWRHSP